MKIEEFEEKMVKECGIIKQSLTKEQINSFYRYMLELIDWNNKINLTAITEKEEIIKKHFIDSLTILKYINENSKIIDIGTGAGFPGIPLKIADNSLEITLLDALNKRVNFLNNIILKLELTNIEAVHSRAEEYVKNDKRETYDVAVSRAVAELPILLEYLMPYIKINGICICMKGPKAEEEIRKSKKAIEILGGKIEKVENIKIDETMERNIVIVRKIKHTPIKYPRKAGIPSKEPII